MRIATPLWQTALLSGLLALSGCNLNLLTGGTSTSENGRVIGRVVDSRGVPSPSVQVRLIPADYDPAKDLSATLPLAITDNDGIYRFSAVDSGTYNVETINTEDKTRGLVSGISVHRDTIVVPADTLKIPGTITVPLSNGLDAENGYFYLPGTTIAGKLNGNTGLVEFESVPAVTGLSILFNFFGSTAAPEFIAANQTVAPGDTLAITNPGWKHSRDIYLNTTGTGAGVSNSVFHFPVLIRLTESNFDFTEAGSRGEDLRFFKQVTEPLPYEIEQWDPGLKSAAIWVKLDTVFGNDRSHFITMLWGNPRAGSVSNGSTVFDTANGYRGIWHLGEDPTGPGAVLDHTQSGNNGTSGGAIHSGSRVGGLVGNCLQFGGWDSYVKVARAVQDDFTIAFWMKTIDNSYLVADSIQWYHGNGLVDAEVSGIGNDFGISLLRNRAAFGTGYRDSALRIAHDTTILSKDFLNDGSWHFISATRSLTSGTMVLYVDGIENSRATGSLKSLDSAATMRFGMLQTGIYPYSGALDEIAVSGKVRSPYWIRLSYMNQRADNLLVEFK